MTQGLRTIRQHWTIVLILTAFLALGAVYDVATPLFEKPDEMWHYPYVKWLGDGQGLPVQNLAQTRPLMKQESTQPPLYYVTAALATFWIEDGDWQDLVWLNPFWGYGAPGTVNDNKNRVLHTDRERFAYRGAVLAIRIARLVSVIWGGITILATYLIGLELSRGAGKQGSRSPEQSEGTGAEEQGSRRDEVLSGAKKQEQRSYPFPTGRVFAAGAAALAAFNPQFLFIASAVSNDSTVSALCTLALWLMLRLVRKSVSITKPQIGHWPLAIGHWVWLGIVLGLALLAKVSALALLPVAMVAIAIASWPRGSGWTFLKVCLIVFGVVAIIAGWWYTLNWQLHGDPLGVRVHQEIVGPGRPKLILAELVHELSQIELSFWAAFGWGNVHADSWIYALLRMTVRLGALGLVIMTIRRGWASWLRRTALWDFAWSRCRTPQLVGGDTRRTRTSSGVRYTTHANSQRPRRTSCQLGLLERATRLNLALLFLWNLLVFVALLRWLQWVFAPSGRHLFPAIASITILLLLGLLQLVPTRWRGKATALLAGAMFVFACICPLAYIAPAYARPPLLSEAEMQAVPNRLDMNFGGVMKLLGYRLLNWETGCTNPGDSLEITLYWQSLAKMNQDYAIFVHLLDENDLILAQRNTFPGLGSFPTTLWQVGDAIADTYTLTLPETTYAPTSAQLEVGLYDVATGERLPVYGARGEPTSDNVRFEEIAVLPRSETGLPNPALFNFGSKIALVGYEMDGRNAEPGEAIHLTLYWQGLARVRDDYTVFVHLLREGDQIWAGADRQPQPATSTWEKEQIIVDQYELAIAPDAPPDIYQVEVGLYLAETGERLDLLDRDGRVMGNRVLLSKVRVK